MATLYGGPDDGREIEVPDDTRELLLPGYPAYPLPVYFRDARRPERFAFVGYRSWSEAVESSMASKRGHLGDE